MRVHGEGPIPAELMLVGEGPGYHESLCGRPFVETAPAGAELSRYLNGYQLPFRESVWITNLVKEWAGGAKTKGSEVTTEDILRDQDELRTELLAVNPRIITTLGSHATTWFLGPGMDLDTVHGLVFHVEWCANCDHHQIVGPKACEQCGKTWKKIDWLVVPCYHPAAGLHRPELAARTAYDLQQVASLLKMPWGMRMERVWQPAAQIPTVTDLGAQSALIGASHLAIDTEGTPDQPWCWSGAHGGPQSPFTGFGPLAIWDQSRVILHNAVWDLQVLEAIGTQIGDDQFDDLTVLAFLLGIEPQSLKALAYRHLGLEMKEYRDVVGKWIQEFTKTGKPKKKKTFVLGTLDDVPRQDAVQYAGMDAEATFRLFPILRQRVSDLGMDEVYQIDLGVLPMYARMEGMGLPIDLPHFLGFQADLTAGLDEKTAEIHQTFPGLNLRAPKQVSHVLYDVLGLTGGKKTKTGHMSTNDKFLEAMKDQHPFVEQLIDWREIDKMKSSFVDQLPNRLHWDATRECWRLRFRILPTRVVSGRIAAKDPNVLALPKRSALGKQFRKGIVAPEGKVLISFDLSQIELRVLALDSQSSYLIQAFQAGQDIHAGTQKRIYGDDTDIKDDALRRDAKIVNFSIPMGTTPIGLVEQLKRANSIPFKFAAMDKLDELHAAGIKADLKKAEEAVAADWIAGVIDLWQITPYIEAKKAEARRYGYVSDRWGRKRWMPSVLSPNQKVKEEAFRQIQAYPMQAGNRGYYKLICGRVWREVIRPWNRDGIDLQPLLDIHDDLLLECPEQHQDEAFTMIGGIFNGSFDEQIPIVAEGKRGKIWATLK